MINNEIRRLLACLVDASKENGTTLNELEVELQRLFDAKKDENETNNLAVATNTFKDRATSFVTREELYKPGLPRRRSISILCVFYELYTNKEYQHLEEKKFREKLAKELGIKSSTSTQLCLQMKFVVSKFLEEQVEYQIPFKQFTITELLLKILPYIESN